MATKIQHILKSNPDTKILYGEWLSRQGLTGDAAVKHYNEWMDRHGMSHLKVPYLT